MKHRKSVLTLGVTDLVRSLVICRDGLGLPTIGIVGQELEHGAVTFFDLAGRLKAPNISQDTGLPVQPMSPTGVDCIPPNDLPRTAPGHATFVVIGAGKTAMDSVLWLLQYGVHPEQISWVRPRDSWLFNRIKSQAGIDFFDHTIGGAVRMMETLAEVSDLETLAATMEAEGLWLRVDKTQTPTMMHMAVASESEVEALALVKNVIRMGHVRRIESGRLIFATGEEAIPHDALVIDCAASAARANIDDHAPVFSAGRINLQMIRPTQPCFSAAVIAHLEATVQDEAIKQAATNVTPMIDTVAHWAERRRTTSLNEAAWNKIDGMPAWLLGCRLNASSHALAVLDRTDAAKMAVLARMGAAVPKAVENIPRLLV